MASATDVVSLARAKTWFSIGQGDTAQDQQLELAISAASDWLDDKAGPIVQRTVDGEVVGRDEFPDTASVAGTRFEVAGLMFAAWLLRSWGLRVAPADSFDAPGFAAAAEPPLDAIRALLGDEWFDTDAGADDPFIGSVTLGVWSTP